MISIFSKINSIQTHPIRMLHNIMRTKQPLIKSGNNYTQYVETNKLVHI